MYLKLKWLAIFIVTFFMITGIIGLFNGKNDIDNSNDALTVKQQRLADPNLLYFYSWWSGMCPNSNNEEGGCYGELYLYTTGRLVKEYAWSGVGDKKEVSPSIEQQFSMSVVEKIVSQIRDSGIMEKDCPDDFIVDAGWDSQINLDGIKKILHNPVSNCEDILNKLNKVIEDNYLMQ